MSSSCSSIDLGIDTDFDDILTESLISDIELFVEHVHRLRKALDTRDVQSTTEFDCETKCVQVHAALSMVSQSVRNLLVKYPNFKTSNVLIPASQLVHSVKGINFDSSKFDAARSLQAIERLEAAIGNALRHSVWMGRRHSSTLFPFYHKSLEIYESEENLCEKATQTPTNRLSKIDPFKGNGSNSYDPQFNTKLFESRNNEDTSVQGCSNQFTDGRLIRDNESLYNEPPKRFHYFGNNNDYYNSDSETSEYYSTSYETVDTVVRKMPSIDQKQYNAPFEKKYYCFNTEDTAETFAFAMNTMAANRFKANNSYDFSNNVSNAETKAKNVVAPAFNTNYMDHQILNTKLFTGELPVTTTNSEHSQSPLVVSGVKPVLNEKSVIVIDGDSTNFNIPIYSSVQDPVEKMITAINQNRDHQQQQRGLNSQSLLNIPTTALATVELQDINGNSSISNEGANNINDGVGNSGGNEILFNDIGTSLCHKTSCSATSSSDTTSANTTWASCASSTGSGSIKSNETCSASVGNRKNVSPYVSSGSTPLRNVMNTTPLSTKQPHDVHQKNARLVRRHSAYQSGANKISNEYCTADHNSVQNSKNLGSSRASGDVPSSAKLMFDILSSHENGMKLAFERCKSWSKYASHLLMFVRNRLALEQEYVRSIQKLSEQTKAVLLDDASNNYLPLVNIFDELMENLAQFTCRTNRTVANLNQRFITTLENRQKEHDSKRRKLKAEWAKQKKQFDACVEELRRAHLTLNSKEGGYLKARDLTLRHEQQVGLPQQGGILSLSLSGTSSSDPQQKKLKELEKKRRNEEDALNRKTDAENEVWRLERELNVRRIELNELRVC